MTCYCETMATLITEIRIPHFTKGSINITKNKIVMNMLFYIIIDFATEKEKNLTIKKRTKVITSRHE